MITGTIALPIWKSKEIAWLCLESLCRMNKSINVWELIVFEEKHNEQCGEEFIMSYAKRLQKVGCENIQYMNCMMKTPLSQKWVLIANHACSTSEYFILCAADNYYSPFMLQDAEKYIKQADWIITTQGYFYDINLDKLLRYSFFSRTGLQMIAKTEKVRKFPMDIVNKGVDMWFSEKIGYNIMIDPTDHWQNILCTNGMNNISTERVEFFTNTQPPFYETLKSLPMIIPIDIYSRLKTLHHYVKNNNSNHGL
jgi:hypothetical protein